MFLKNIKRTSKNLTYKNKVTIYFKSHLPRVAYEERDNKDANNYRFSLLPLFCTLFSKKQSIKYCIKSLSIGYKKTVA